ncbi:Ig-like domain-containing protein, partial [Kordia sp.]|uniref:Ig-like domain-containing protein n=1 Tax=Kordia sp. TaxID=1965332 RepID=UPI003D6BD14B
MLIFSNESKAQVVTTWGGLSGTTPENNFQTSSLSAVGDGVTFVTVDITRGPSVTTGGIENAVPPALILTNSFNNTRTSTGVSGNTYTYTFSEPVHVILSSQEHSELVRTENIKISSPDAGALFSGSLTAGQTGHFVNNNNSSEIHIGSSSSITTAGTYWTVQSNIAITTLTVEYYVTDGTEAASGEPFTLDLAPVPYIRLDDTNSTGAGAININVPGCSKSAEFLDAASTGATSIFNAPHGLDFMTITLTNPQDAGNETLNIKGIFPGISVSGNGTTTLTVTNESADVNTLRNSLDDLVYVNSTAVPEIVTPRTVDITVTDPFGNTSAAATATLTLTNPPNSGATSGPFYVFTTDTTVDLFNGLDGSEDAGGTWMDNDATGALSGSTLTVASLPLGPSTFNYVVTGTGPCSDETTTVLVIKLEGTEIALTAPAASSNCGTLTTSYSNAIFSANSDDPIFVYDGGVNVGQLECPAGTGVTTYDWYVFNPTTNSYQDYALNSTRIQTGLADGGYLVVRNDGGTIEEGRAWVWNTSIQTQAGSDFTACEGDTVMLNGIAANNTDFTYYNPVERPFAITNSTIVSVTFNVTHTYISDVGYYLVSPDGLVTIPLGLNETGSPCYAADNAVNLTFTNDQTITPTLPVFDICEFARNNACSGAGPALTGTYNAYYSDPSNNSTVCTVFSPAAGINLIDMTPLNGYDARQGGWKVQIYDCEFQDFGEIDSVIISFVDGSNTSTFTSGTIPNGTPSAQINDDSCTAATASIYEVPFTTAVAVNEALNIQDNIGVNGSGGYAWSYSTDGPTGPWSTPFEIGTLTPSVTVNETTWFRLNADNGTMCAGEDVVQVTVTDKPVAGTGTDNYACAGDTVVDLNTLISGADSGGTWTVSGSSPNAPGGDFSAGAGTYDPTTGGVYTFDYTVNAAGPCTVNEATSVTVSVQAAPDAGLDNTIVEDNTSGVIDLFTNLLGTPDIGGTWSVNGSSVAPGASFDQSAGTLDASTLTTSGTYVFDYSVTSCLTSIATITINFTAIVATTDGDGDGNPDTSDPNPGAPTATDDTATTDIGVPIIIDVLNNDDYLDNNDLTNEGVTTVTDTGTGTATGIISIDPITGEITYAPTLAEFGTDVTIIYEVCNDASGAPICERATITITITGADLDADGVPDIADLDNDNDGILDSVECPSTGGSTSSSFIPNGDFNDNYIDINNPGTPFTTGQVNSVPSPWGQASTPDISATTLANFNGTDIAIASLPGFNPSPVGGSFMGFRSNFGGTPANDEGMFNTLQIDDINEEITIQFYYTEYTPDQIFVPSFAYVAPSSVPATDPLVNIGFKLDLDSSSTLPFTSPAEFETTVLNISNFDSSGGTPGTWEVITVTFIPSSVGVTTPGPYPFYLGSLGSGIDTWVFVDGLVVVPTSALSCDTDNDGVLDYLDLDSDNDGIYDVVEAGGTDNNNDGIADGAVGTTPTTNGIPATAGTGTTPTDTLGDGSLDYVTLDSDGDGCSDANEAYGNSTADGGDTGVYGPDPATVNPTNGLVTSGGVTYADPVNTDYQ